MEEAHLFQRVCDPKEEGRCEKDVPLVEIVVSLAEGRAANDHSTMMFDRVHAGWRYNMAFGILSFDAVARSEHKADSEPPPKRGLILVNHEQNAKSLQTYPAFFTTWMSITCPGNWLEAIPSAFLDNHPSNNPMTPPIPHAARPSDASALISLPPKKVSQPGPCSIIIQDKRYPHQLQHQSQRS